MQKITQDLISPKEDTWMLNSLETRELTNLEKKFSNKKDWKEIRFHSFSFKDYSQVEGYVFNWEEQTTLKLEIFPSLIKDIKVFSTENRIKSAPIDLAEVEYVFEYRQCTELENFLYHFEFF